MSRGNNGFTVQERIMLHLSNYNGFREHYLNPDSITQSGIANAVDIARNHVPRAIDSLNDGNFIIEMKGRVKGSERRKKVYFLSDKGMQMAKELKERQSHVDSFSLDIPCSEGFIGRESEIKEIEKALKSDNIVLISGEQGIGKTYLTSRIVDGATKKDSVLWYGVSTDGTLLSMLRIMSEFLSREGSGLLGYHLGSTSLLVHEDILTIMKDTMNNCTIVLDDIQNADADAIKFISLIVKDIRKFEKVRVILVSNSFDEYSFDSLKNIKLSGLDRKNV
ncbi:MAG: AAA family ATPase, partial [Gammaproteobacteria bacterium]|nr:AAA family ATPase [Gammaproteobacteria bacterium]